MNRGRARASFSRFFRAKLSPCDRACQRRAITDLALSSGTLAKRPNPWYFLRIFPSLTTEPSFFCGCYRKESGRLWVEGTRDVLDRIGPAATAIHGRRNAGGDAGYAGRVAHLCLLGVPHENETPHRLLVGGADLVSARRERGGRSMCRAPRWSRSRRCWLRHRTWLCDGSSVCCRSAVRAGRSVCSAVSHGGTDGDGAELRQRDAAGSLSRIPQ